MSGKTGLTVFIVVALVVLLCSSVFYTVDQRELAILMHFNKPVEKVIEPGLHVKWPIISTVHRYDSRLRVLTTRPITYVLADRKPIILEAYLCWRIVKPLSFYRKLRTEPEAMRKIVQVASSALRIEMSKYPITEIVSVDKDRVKLSVIEDKVRSDVDDTMTTLAADAVEITRVGINRIALPRDNEQAVYKRMNAEREVAKSAYENEGREKAKEITAKADTAAAKIVEDAKKEAQTVRAAGEAKAIELYREAYSKDREFYRFWRTLETYKRVFGAETTMVVPLDSEFMRYFRMSEAEKVPK